MADKVKIRYRGYYYDDETGFYYLQSRYYDPSLCRFISSDQYELTKSLSKIPGQLNLYAYCNNNPIMYTDESCESFILSLVIAIVCGGLIGATTGAIGAWMTGEDILGGIASGFLIGGVLGAAAFWGGVTVLTLSGKMIEGFTTTAMLANKGLFLAKMVSSIAVSSFCAGVGAYAIEQFSNDRDFELNAAILNGLNTTVKGLTNFGVGMALASAGAYNSLLLKKIPFVQNVINGIEKGIVSNVVKAVHTPWYWAK